MLSFLVAPFYQKNDKEATRQNISFFLAFNDPTVPEHQVGSMLVAIILKALLAMKEAGRVDATPANVLKYMHSRAKRSPQDMPAGHVTLYAAQVFYFDTTVLKG
jgi:hypothetical protein